MTTLLECEPSAVAKYPRAVENSLMRLAQEGVASIRRGETNTIVLPPGVHEIHADLLAEKYCFISNNDEGLKRILFDLEGLEDVTIDGNFAELRIHGRVLPFHLKDARNIRIQNLSIDWVRPYLSQGKIVGAADGRIDLAIPPEYPCEVRRDRLIFHGDSYLSDYLKNMLPFDPRRGETAFEARDQYHLARHHRAENLGAGVVRVHGDFEHYPRVGEIMVITHDQRLHPAIFISDCENVHLESIDLFHAGGMGVIAQNSADLTLIKVNVRRRPESNRLFSAHADATHFVNCTGRIHLSGCLFENQLDDSTNIHGIFLRVTGKTGPNRIRTQLMHFQQFGVDTIRPGDEVAFYDSQTFQPVFQTVASEVHRLNRELSQIVLADRLPELPWKNLVLTRHTRDVQVKIEDCEFRNNRARGLLISTLGEVRIRNNRFHTPGAAIKISGDANHWFESGPVDDVEISNNVFDNCNFGIWGAALFDIDPEIPERYRSGIFHRNIRIHDNEIRCFHRRLLHARCVEHLDFYANDIANSKDYPARGEEPAITFDGFVKGRVPAFKGGDSPL